jgi:hypothetical protein
MFSLLCLLDGLWTTYKRLIQDLKFGPLFILKTYLIIKYDDKMREIKKAKNKAEKTKTTPQPITCHKNNDD